MIALPLAGARPAQAGVINVPPQAEGLVDVQDVLDMVSHMAWARSAELLAYLDALDEVMTPLIEAARAELGADMPAITDIDRLRSDWVAKLESIDRAGSIAAAEAIVATLESEGQAVGNTLRNLETELRGLEPLLRARAAVIEAELRAQMETEVQAKAAEIEAELNRIGEEKGAAAEAEIRARAEAYARSTQGTTVDMDEVNAKVNGWVAESKARITAEMETLAAEKEQEIREWAEQKALRLQEENFGTFIRIQEGFADISQRLENRAAERKAFYETHYDEFLRLKKAVVIEAMTPQYEAAVAQIKQREAEIELAVQSGRLDVPSMAELIAEFDMNWQSLTTAVTNAVSPEEIDQAIAGFRTFWEMKQSQLELALSRGTDELVRVTLEKLREDDTAARLNEAKAKMVSLVAGLESGIDLSDEGKSKLRLMKEVLPLIDEALEIIGTFEGSEPGTDIAALMALKDRLEAGLTEIVSQVSRLE
jgi:hypothetical protein